MEYMDEHFEHCLGRQEGRDNPEAALRLSVSPRASFSTSNGLGGRFVYQQYMRRCAALSAICLLLFLLLAQSPCLLSRNVCKLFSRDRLPFFTALVLVLI